MDWDKLNALVATQHQLVTTKQFRDHGATAAWIRWVVSDGRFVRLRHGVYALAGSTSSQYQALMGATLAAGPTAAASHLAAAWLWGAEQVAQGPVEVTSFDGHIHRLPDVRTHRSKLDPATAIKFRHDIPTVAAPLTIVQLARTMTPLFVERLADDLVKKHCTTFREILTWIDTVGGGRSRELRDFCLKAASVGGHDDSPPARRICEKLLRAGVEPFEVDYQVVTPEGVLLVDVAWPRPMVGLEYNGFRDHSTYRGLARDARRMCRLGALGWRILPVTSAMTHDEVIAWVMAALAAAPSA